MLLPEQAAAAYELTKHVSVTAGPGSGKTTVLVERYLHILRKHELSIDQIVAITFTNRAANEMRERLRDELHQILLTATGSERKRWLQYKRTLDGAVITTIHGFCARLLREFPVEARIDPQFLLLDEHRAAMLLESIVEETLTEFISGGHVEVSRLTLGVGRSKLAAGLAGIYRAIRGQGLSLEKLAKATAKSHATEADLTNALAELDRAMGSFLAVRRTTPAATENLASVRAEWPELRRILQEIPTPEMLADYCRAVDTFRKLRPQARGAVAEHVRALDELLWNRDLLGRVPQTCLDLFARQYGLEVVNVLTRIEEKLGAEKQKLSALDFDDLELRALEVLQRPEVLTRAAERYKYFLVDEFQDTNALQRQLLEQLVLSTKSNANLFIVGDRKQSIYGFRGADVDVFREMTRTLLEAGGEEKPLLVNFRSQPPLIAFFNHLFARLFVPTGDAVPTDTDQLGYVAHEPSEPKRELRDSGALVELLITTKPVDEHDPRAEQSSREADAEQLARRIASLTSPENESRFCYSDIALLFRAMTQVQIYESVFRRANIPYQTVLGRGFYEREEITDLVQLLRFLDNKTDELALAAVLRSPLCGISDNALFALRCGPLQETVDREQPLATIPTRPLYRALRTHHDIAFIDEGEHELLDRAASLIKQLISRRHRYSIEELLRFAVDRSEYLTVVAANFDGAQRLANVQRLFTLAARFEHSGATHLIRDFVRYVEEFEAIGSRESEGQIDEAANAVRLMTIHQAKGLEFPVVIIPDMQRLSRGAGDNWFLLDRHRGLTLKVPDGRGKLVAGCTYTRFEERQSWREQFESMRLLYVAATRARDRLILSGAVGELESLIEKEDREGEKRKQPDSWLKWVWQSLEMSQHTRGGLIELAPNVLLDFVKNLGAEPTPTVTREAEREVETAAEPDALERIFPLLSPIVTARDDAFQRFSVTQLINYQRCPRQYYFDRVLGVASADELSIWNNAEAPEPPANLTATLKGAVIHRFCERYTPGEDTEACLRRSFDDIVRLRQAELADRIEEINIDTALKDMLPLAQNYLQSEVFARIEKARNNKKDELGVTPTGEPGLWSEVGFRLRRPLGILSGTIDKLLVTSSSEGLVEIEIIDFKTNRITGKRSSVAGVRGDNQKATTAVKQTQFAFDFEANSVMPAPVAESDALQATARDYQLQMQAYALAVRELLPSLAAERIRVTLHFLEPNLEFQLEEQLLDAEVCKASIDEAMLQVVSSSQPAEFPVKTASHCRMCNFLRVCVSGREFVRARGDDPGYRTATGRDRPTESAAEPAHSKELRYK